MYCLNYTITINNKNIFRENWKNKYLKNLKMEHCKLMEWLQKNAKDGIKQLNLYLKEKDGKNVQRHNHS